MPHPEDRKTLHELARVAHERELTNELQKLAAHFSDWQDQRLSSVELERAIRNFHEGPSQRIRSQYGSGRPDLIVSRAIALGLLSEDEVPEEVLLELSPQIESIRDQLEAEAE